MKNQHFDIVILGSGFGATLLAMIVAKQGLQVAVIERGAHPRFAVGESSTPIADMILHDLAKRYGLDRISPLATYGSLRESYPDLVVGRKRGFSYFRHVPGQSFEPSEQHTSELLVAASADDQSSDTNWLRSSVDHFFASEMVAAGIPLFERTTINSIEEGDPWCLRTDTSDGPVELSAKFIVDASGAAGVLTSAMQIGRDPRMLSTRTRSVYGHFRNVRSWHEMLIELGANVDTYPFRSDDAALHHLLDEGWMWQLRFDNGVTSLGFVIDLSTEDKLTGSDGDIWEDLLARYPSLREQLANAELVAPEDGLQTTDRLQFIAERAAGSNWACLPSTAGFIDPLHSTGIAHTLAGVERLAHIIEHHWNRPTLRQQACEYDVDLRLELRFIDQLISNCYRSRQHFEAFEAATMLYFAAAHSYEMARLRSDRSDPEQIMSRGFLSAKCADFWTPVHCFNEMAHTLQTSDYAPDEVARFYQSVRRAIEPFNEAGLCDPAAHHIYRYTAIESKTDA